jgi:site-specific recombinase
MTLTLSLPPEMEQYLVQSASEQGLSTEDYTLQLLTTVIPSTEKNTKLANLLQRWIDQGDAEEQQETGDYLIQTLDADRLSDRPLYPTEMKGVSW